MDLLKGLHGEFAWFIWGLFFLGVIWFFTGGMESETAHEGAYLEPLAPIDSGRAYGTYYEGSDARVGGQLNLPRAPGNFLRGIWSGRDDEAVETSAVSFSPKKIFFEDYGRAKESDPNEEFLRIKAGTEITFSQKITGLALRGTEVGPIIIPQAVNLPVLGTTPVKSDILIPPDGHAVIITGRSPIGVSFRVNKCSGYMEQFQNHVPDLDKICPTPLETFKKSAPTGDSGCEAFVEKIPRCEIYQGAPPKSLSSSCVSFLAEKLNYNACVADHKNDKDFYKNEWRIYLNQPKELWENRGEIIRLTDSKGTVIDAITY